jgi:DNA-binding transcriptional regulator WhiA
MEKRINEKLEILTDREINSALRRTKSIETVIKKSNLKTKPEVLINIIELRLIIKQQSLLISSHV